MKRGIILALIFLLLSCGGSGGGDDFKRYAGAWSGYVNLVNNTCPRQIPEQFITINLLHNVEESVSVDSLGNKTLDIVLNDGKDTYIGVGELDKVNGDSFSVLGSANELPGFLSGFTCIEVLDFQYNGISLKPSDDPYVSYTATAGYVERHSTITCTKGTEIQTCDVTYTGFANRS